MKEDEKNKTELLQFAINDAQEIIRFTETKTAICITVISAHFVALYTMLSNLTSPLYRFPVYFWVILSILLIGHVFVVYVTYRIILPRVNPLDQLNVDTAALPQQSLYLENTKSGWLNVIFTNNARIKQSFSKYFDMFLALDQEKMIQLLVLELHKVSYIRNIKIARLRVLVGATLVTSAVFIILILLYYLHLDIAVPLV